MSIMMITETLTPQIATAHTFTTNNGNMQISSAKLLLRVLTDEQKDIHE